MSTHPCNFSTQRSPPSGIVVHRHNVCHWHTAQQCLCCGPHVVFVIHHQETSCVCKLSSGHYSMLLLSTIKHIFFELHHCSNLILFTLPILYHRPLSAHHQAKLAQHSKFYTQTDLQSTFHHTLFTQTMSHHIASALLVCDH